LAWTIKYTSLALRQLKKLDKSIALQVLDFIDHRIALLDDPRASGKNLAGPILGSYWRYRVGDLRIICDVQNEQLIILLIEVGHRSRICRS
jgi:mRNA interferase RelE/StbE